MMRFKSDQINAASAINLEHQFKREPSHFNLELGKLSREDAGRNAVSVFSVYRASIN